MLTMTSLLQRVSADAVATGPAHLIRRAAGSQATVPPIADVQGAAAPFAGRTAAPDVHAANASATAPANARTADSPPRPAPV